MSTNVHTAAYANSLIVQAIGPGTVTGISAHNKDAADTIYLMVFKQGTVPANTAVPPWAPIPLVPQASGGQYAESLLPRSFTAGCVIVGSSTADTLTIVSGADLRIDAVLA